MTTTHTGFHVHRSNRVERLVDALAALPAPTDPFAPEVIALQSRGMGRWLEMRLADDRGIIANARFTSPDDLVAEAVARALGDDPNRPDPWSPGRLRWHVLAAIPRLLEAPAFKPLKHYLDLAGGDPRDRRRVVLAGRVAEVFHRYTIYRPELVARWEAGDDAGATWQPALWRALSDHLGPHLGHRVAAFHQALATHGAEALTGFPDRVAIFGVNTLPPQHLGVLRAVARHREVHLMVLTASPDGWSQVRQGLLDGSNPRFRNRLLSSFDRLSADLQRLLEAPDAPGAAVTLHDAFEPPKLKPHTALGVLHSDIFHLRDRGAPSHQRDLERRPPPHTISDHDRSLRVHICHGAMRQVEVLRDELLALLEQERTLQPRDICVMTPDIETYAPLIQAVFADGDVSSGERGFPALHQIHDLSLYRSNPWAEAFLRILDLASGRLKASEVIELLAMPPAAAVAGVEPDDLQQVRRWLRDSGVRWGRDAAHRADHGQPRDGHHTWRFGFDRLLLGHAMSNDGFDRFARVSPYDDIEGKAALTLGRVVDYLERLFDFLDALRTRRTLAEWRDTLSTLLDELLIAGDDDAEARAQPIREEISKLIELSQDAAFGEPLGLEAVRALLDAPFKARRSTIAFLSGGLTFCTMVPMRNIPFRVICLLGMDDGSFPRGVHGLGFDLTQQGVPAAGDRAPRDDDRQVFLETLLSARDHLIITYAGRSLVDNKQLEPCGPVAELVAVLERGFRGAPWRFEHPLSPFSPANFTAGSAANRGQPWSYDARYLEGAKLLVGGRADTPAFILAEAPLPPQPPVAVDLSTLVAFFNNPAKAFFKDRLGVSFADVDDRQPDQAPLELDGLGRWAVGRDLIRWRLAGASEEESRDAVLADGRLPPGRLAEVAVADTQRRADKIYEQLELRRRGELRAVSLDVEVAGVRLTGRVEDVDDVGRLAFHPTAARAKQLVEHWILHLALTLSDHGEGSSRLVAGDGVHQLTRCAPTYAHERLAALIQLYQQGLTRPLPFAPMTSKAYFDQLERGKPPRLAKYKALYAWRGDFNRFPEVDDPHARRAWGERDLFEDPRFDEITREVFGPMARLLRKERIR
ncbi:MAG: exodeoxyribonuclease V subunit gamma [Proteobacteria bacterium]|nr:MAG: exodeoxyribonuclease V subunit gamma [Pseudomonadota bacterium]